MKAFQNGIQRKCLYWRPQFSFSLLFNYWSYLFQVIFLLKMCYCVRKQDSSKFFSFYDNGKIMFFWWNLNSKNTLLISVEKTYRLNIFIKCCEQIMFLTIFAFQFSTKTFHKIHSQQTEKLQAVEKAYKSSFQHKHRLLSVVTCKSNMKYF